MDEIDSCISIQGLEVEEHVNCESSGELDEVLRELRLSAPMA